MRAARTGVPRSAKGKVAGGESKREREGKREREIGRTKETAGPLHPRSYYNRSSESLLKRVYTGLGVDSDRAYPSPPRPSPLPPFLARARAPYPATGPRFQPTWLRSAILFSLLSPFRLPPVLLVPRIHTSTPMCVCVRARAHGEPCVRSNAYLIVACMNSESRSTRGYEPDPS